MNEASGSGGTLFPERGTCRRTATEGRWTCDVLDSSSSGGVSYDVRVRDGSSCWHARRRGDRRSGVGMPQQVSGCVHLWQWSLLALE